MLKTVGTILGVIKEKLWEPVIFFSFARKECEAYAGSLLKFGDKFDFNTEEEKNAIEEASPIYKSILCFGFYNALTPSASPSLCRSTTTPCNA